MPSVGLAQVEFKSIQLWVQIHDHGLENFSVDNARVIGAKIGNFIKTEEEVENTHKTYTRLKVEVNVEKPLLAGFWWINSGDEEQWASIKYERLFDFFYGCRKLGYTS